MKCTLCDEPLNHFYTRLKKEYYHCGNCFSISMGENCRMDSYSEKSHYEKHENDVYDLGYQNFVSPIVNAIVSQFSKTHHGLDFGSGTAPVITKMLQDLEYNILPYDFYFANHPKLLEKKYDYIACCEVMEHFYHPKKEFEMLAKMLKPNGKLFCKTSLYSEQINFDSWYYKNDLTHVFFYHEKTIAWIAKEFNFKSYLIENKLITFTK
jgi:SAM-dependent methyltransferase